MKHRRSDMTSSQPARLVKNPEEFIANVCTYQRGPNSQLFPALDKVSVNSNRAWYYVKSIDRAANAKFAAYYDRADSGYTRTNKGDGREAVRHLERKGWFTRLQPHTNEYESALKAVQRAAVRFGASANGKKLRFRIEQLRSTFDHAKP